MDSVIVVASMLTSSSSTTASIPEAVQKLDPSVVSASLGFIGVIIGAILSSIVTLLNARSNHKADEMTTGRMLSSQYITDKRVQWIQDLRSEIAVFAANVRFVLGYSKLKDTTIYEAQIPQSIIEVLRTGRKIQLMLNPEDDKDLVGLIENVLADIPEAINNNVESMRNIKANMDAILTKTQKTLKDEWERSKREIREGKA